MLLQSKSFSILNFAFKDYRIKKHKDNHDTNTITFFAHSLKKIRRNVILIESKSQHAHVCEHLKLMYNYKLIDRLWVYNSQDIIFWWKPRKGNWVYYCFL